MLKLEAGARERLTPDTTSAQGRCFRINEFHRVPIICVCPFGNQIRTHRF